MDIHKVKQDRFATVSNNTSVAQVDQEEKVKPRRRVQNLTEQQLKLFKGYEELLIEVRYQCCLVLLIDGESC